MPELAPTQKARLASALRDVEACVSEALAAIDPASLRSPVSSRHDDVTAVQQRLAADYAEVLRSTMGAIAKRHAIRVSPSEGALAAARAALERAVVSVEELEPRIMSACGPVPDELEGELNRIVAQLFDMLDHMRGCLAPRVPPAESIEPRRMATDRARLLEALGRAISGHGLANLRGRLEALTERFETSGLEIAAFGRTNSGKSSLLNDLLGKPVLPVGMTPVTAVPIYVSYGSAAWGYATFADAAPEKFALGRLPEFAAEHFNPTNLRHVTRLRVEVPAPELADRLTLVDMPGRSFGGFAEAPSILAAAPCCDVGLVLIDAAAGLTLEEAVIIDALHRAGCSVLVLLTKADLLPHEERWRIHGHVSRGLSAMIGHDVVVHLASTVAADPELRRDWIERGLKPLLQRGDRLREHSLDIKLDCLCSATIAALERRLDVATTPTLSASAWKAADAGLMGAQAFLQSAPREKLDPRSEAERQTTALVNEVAYNAAVLWPQSHTRSLDITTLLAESLRARANGYGKTAAREIRKLTAQCSVPLAAAATAVGILRAEASELPLALDPPVFDEVGQVATIVLRQPALAFLGHWRRFAGARHQLAHSAARFTIARAMEAHFVRVADWRFRALAALSEAFAAKQAALRARWLELARARSTIPDAEVQPIADTLSALRATQMHSMRPQRQPA